MLGSDNNKEPEIMDCSSIVDIEKEIADLYRLEKEIDQLVDEVHSLLKENSPDLANNSLVSDVQSSLNRALIEMESTRRLLGGSNLKR